MEGTNTGTVTQVIGAVVDVEFSSGALPNINNAIEIPVAESDPLVLEVQR
ncbi:MAG TPA: F0F1 ATP synthase subunit beta, partial [Candidatus Latescibacteria bacterium]|nr:F0F1 ATP synthase subunit beta [Candidatus Latescibacterota bacterium]